MTKVTVKKTRTKGKIKDITLSVEIVPEHTLYMLTSIGSGEIEGKRFTIDACMPSGSHVVTIGKHRYRLTLEELVKAIYKLDK